MNLSQPFTPDFPAPFVHNLCILFICSLAPSHQVDILGHALYLICHCQANTDPVPFSIIVTFNMSKPSQSTLINHQANWFQSQQFSQLCILSFSSFPSIWSNSFQFSQTLPHAPLSLARSHYLTVDNSLHKLIINSVNDFVISLTICTK